MIKSMNFKSKKKQSGVALITAVLIVALAVVASVSIAENYQLNFRRTVTAFNSGQAWSYAKGAEEWAMAILARDQKDNGGYDGHDEAWWNNGEPLVFPLPGGLIEGKLEDVDGKLNVNLLMKTGKPDPVMYKRFERLFASLGINVGLVGAIQDWVDADQDFTGADGAEADIYIGLEPPYLPADQAMSDISELRLVHGIDEEIYNKLLPHITALPSDTILNLNTASANVLESLGQNIPQGVGEELVAERVDKPFKQPNDFAKHPRLQGITLDINDGSVGVGSNYFLLNTKCVVGNSQVKMVSMIHRGSGNNLKVVKRSQKL
jgi:general secretion pathway protein K